MSNINKKILEIIQRINNKPLIDFALENNIHPMKLQKVIKNKNEKLTYEEIMRIWNNYEYKFSLNEILKLFDYECSDKVVRGEIYWVDFGEGKGSIQGNMRPAVIVSNNKNNKFSPTINVAPITSSTTKTKIPSHVEIRGCGLEKDSIILVEQTRTVNKTDLKSFIGYCDRDTLLKLNKAIDVQFETKENHFSMDSFVQYFISKYKLKDPVKLSNILLKEYDTFCQLV